MGGPDPSATGPGTRTVPLLTDDDLDACLPMSAAIEAVEAALRERVARTAFSPPRTTAAIGPLGLTVTPGGFQGLGALGARLYLRGARATDQVTLVWKLQGGELAGIYVGSGLGARRTGATGGIAVRTLAPRQVRLLAVVGGGAQSFAQLEAIRSVHPELGEVQLYRRDPARRRTVAAAWSAATGIAVHPAASAEEAVRAAQVIVLATGATTPVIEPRWLSEGVHVNSLGPKDRGASEIGLDLVERSHRIVSDVPEAYRSEEAFLLQGTPYLDRIEDLADALEHPAERGDRTTTLFLSHGLPGTEVAVAHRAFANALKRGIGQRIAVP